MENRPDGAGAGRNATEPRSGLFYLMLTNGRYASMYPFESIQRGCLVANILPWTAFAHQGEL